MNTKEITSDSYFFANKKINWFLVSISFVTPTIIGPYLIAIAYAESAFLYLLFYAVFSALFLLVFGKYIAPYFYKNNIETFPEYFERRYNRSLRYLISAVLIIFNIFFKLLVAIIIGSLVIGGFTGLDINSSLLFFIIISGIYVTIGGLKADIYVNSIQLALIIFSITGFSIYTAFFSESIQFSFNGTTEFIGQQYHLSWPFLLLGLPILAFWSWCSDHFMILKGKSIKNQSNVFKASVSASILQIIPLMIFSILLLSFNSNSVSIVSSAFDLEIFPEVVKLFIIIIISAGLIASLANFYSSTTSLVILDFFKTRKTEISDRKLVLTGRITTIILLLISIPLIPFAQSLTFDTAIELLKILTYSASVITALYFISLLNSNLKSVDIYITLIISFSVVCLKAVMDLFIEMNTRGNSVIHWIAECEFLEFSIVIFLLSVVIVFVSNKFIRFSGEETPGIKPIKNKLIRLK